MKKEKVSILHEVGGFDGFPVELTDEDMKKLEEMEDEDKKKKEDK